MKERNGIKKIENIFEILVSVYIGVIIYLSFFESLKYILVVFMASGGIYFCIHYCSKYNQKGVYKADSIPSSGYNFFVIAFAIIFAGQLFYWLAYFPGGFNLDAYGQWDQVHGWAQWSNWHPILTTAIYWLITRIYNSFAFCIFVQISAFSLVAAGLLEELAKKSSNKRWLVCMAAFIGWNPAIATNNICLIKDSPFVIVIMGLFWCYIKIVRSNGRWLSSPIAIITLIILNIMGLMIRHNAVFLIVPFGLFLCLAFRENIKHLSLIAILSLFVVGIVEGPIFSALNVQQHSNAVGEMVGIPMAAMANALINDADNVPEDVEEFMLEIADIDEWKKHYYVGEWDSCKWEFGGIELFQDESLFHIISLYWDTMKSCPNAVYQSFRENTRVVWQVAGESYWDTWIYIEDNHYGITEAYNTWCRWIVDKIIGVSCSRIGAPFTWNNGVTIIIYFYLLLQIIKIKRVKRIGMIIALLAYDFLTMLLLCGPSYRYFYVNLVLLFPMISLIYEAPMSFEYGKSSR